MPATPHATTSPDRVSEERMPKRRSSPHSKIAPPIRLSILLLRPRQRRDAEVAEAEVRRRVVPLDADVARLAVIALPGVLPLRPVVGPVHLLHALDPLRAVPPARHVR